MIEIIRVEGLPEIRPGDDLALLITAAVDLRDRDVVVVAQKVVSKAEGALVEVAPGEDRAAARRHHARLEAIRVVADTPSALIVQTTHGLICANAGIDASNVGKDRLTLLPRDPDVSAKRLRTRFIELAGVEVAVIIADTFGRPWRLGQTDVAIGAAGLYPLRDERGTLDREGMPLEVTQVAVADELAAAADLVRRKADGVPVVVVRGVDVESDETAGASLLVRPLEDDLFLYGRGRLADALAAAGDRGCAARSGAVPPEDLARAVAAAEAIGGGLAAVTEKDGTLHIHGADHRPESLIAAGAAAGALVAALLDLGYDPSWRLDGVVTLVEVGVGSLRCRTQGG